MKYCILSTYARWKDIKRMLATVSLFNFKGKKNHSNMNGFDPRAYDMHTTTLTTRPLWFRCKVMILFKYYSVNLNPK